MKTTAMNPVKAFTLFAFGLAIAAMGIYVANADGSHPTNVLRSTSVRPIWLSPPSGDSALPSANGLRRFHVSEAMRTPRRSAW